MSFQQLNRTKSANHQNIWTNELERALKHMERNARVSETYKQPVHHTPNPNTRTSPVNSCISCTDSDSSQDGSGSSFNGVKKGKKQALSNQCVKAVIRLLNYFPPGTTNLSLGWVALKQIWNISESELDPCVLQTLQTYYTPRQQEHMLLAFAAIDLSTIVNLSAYLHCLIKEHDQNRQVCLYFLADLCVGECGFMHPVGTEGWKLLQDRWGLTYKDFDYNVLNYLAKFQGHQQASILKDLSTMNLGSVHNLSAYLSNLIQKFEMNLEEPKKKELSMSYINQYGLKSSSNHGNTFFNLAYPQTNSQCSVVKQPNKPILTNSELRKSMAISPNPIAHTNYSY